MGISYSKPNPSASWYHQALQSQGPNPIRMSIDYQLAEWSSSGDGNDVTVQARPAWLNVMRPDLNANSQVQAEWTEDLYDANGDGPKTFDVPLTYAGDGRFTAQLPDTDAGWAGGGDSGDEVQGLKVTVDGQPLADPINGTQTFNTDLWGSTGHAFGYYPSSR